MNLKDMNRFSYQKGETFYQELGLRLLTAGMTNKLKDRRRVSSTCVAVRTDDAVELTLFETLFAVMPKTGGMVLDSGGWRTRYTRNQIETLLPKGCRIDTIDGLWRLTTPHHSGLFRDGCIVMEDGHVKHGGTEAQFEARHKLILKAKRFCKRYIERFDKGEVPVPGPGDCLYCQMEAGQQQQCKTGVLMEDGQLRPHTIEEAADHIRNHIDEGYFVPSLLNNAYADAKRPGFSARVLLQYRWGQGGKDGNVTTQFYERERARGLVELRRILANYLKKRLGAEFGGRGWQSG